MPQRSCPGVTSRWHRLTHSAWRALWFALLFVNAVSFASPTAAAEPLKDIGRIQAHVAGFSVSLFKFQTIVEDDGKDSAGGWQQTNAILGFSDGRGNIVPQVWTCNVTIGMPLRTTLDGAISASKAAQIAAKVTTDASGAVMDKQTNWLPALFCIAFERAMRDIFKDKYKSLGARVSVK